jgi:hypothetical protein
MRPVAAMFRECRNTATNEEVLGAFSHSNRSAEHCKRLYREQYNVVVWRTLQRKSIRGRRQNSSTAEAGTPMFWMILLNFSVARILSHTMAARGIRGSQHVMLCGKLDMQGTDPKEQLASSRSAMFLSKTVARRKHMPPEQAPRIWKAMAGQQEDLDS